MTGEEAHESDEIITTEGFLFLCKQIGLSIDELSEMTVGSVIEYAQESIEHQKGEKTYTRKATQTDFDNF